MENNTTILKATADAQKNGVSRRGFASMNKERHKLVSSKGGKAVRSNYTSRNETPTPAVSSSPVN